MSSYVLACDFTYVVGFVLQQSRQTLLPVLQTDTLLLKDVEGKRSAQVCG